METEPVMPCASTSSTARPKIIIPEEVCLDDADHNIISFPMSVNDTRAWVQYTLNCQAAEREQAEGFSTDLSSQNAYTEQDELLFMPEGEYHERFHPDRTYNVAVVKKRVSGMMKKGFGPSMWKSASIIDKYDHSKIEGANVSGVIIYHDAHIVEERTANFNSAVLLKVNRYECVSVIPIRSTTTRHEMFVLRSLLANKETCVTLQDALILRDMFNITMTLDNVQERDFTIRSPFEAKPFPERPQLYFKEEGKWKLSPTRRARMEGDDDCDEFHEASEEPTWTAKRFLNKSQLGGLDSAVRSAKKLESLVGAMNHLPDAVTHMEHAAINFSTAAQTATRLLDKLTSFVPTEPSTVQSIKTALHAVLNMDIPSIGVYLMRIIHVIEDVMRGAFKCKNVLKSIALFTHRVLMALDLDHWIGAKLGEYFGNWINKQGSDPKPRAQALGEEDVLSPYRYAISMAVAFIFGKTATSTEIKSLIDKCTLGDKLSRSFKTLESFIVSMLGYLPEGIQRVINSALPETFWDKHVANGKYAAWAMMTENFLNETTPADYIYDLTVRAKLFKFEEQGQQLYIQGATEMKGAAGSKWYTHINQLSTRLMKAAKQVRETMRNQVEREEPFCLYMTGTPGVGKSRLTDTLTRLLHPPGITDPNSVKYSRGHTRYWDGYTGQPIVFIDDFFQVPDAEAALELINLVSPIKMPLDMASVDNPAVGVKGTPFTSEVVIVTSNTAYPRPNELVSQAALWRRRHVLVEVTSALNGGVADQKAFKDDCSHLRFNILHPVESNAPPMKSNLNLEEFLEHVYESYMKHKTFQESRRKTDQTTRDIADQVRARCVERRTRDAMMPLMQGGPLPWKRDTDKMTYPNDKKLFTPEELKSRYEPGLTVPPPEHDQLLLDFYADHNALFDFDYLARVRATKQWNSFFSAYRHVIAADIECIDMTEEDIERGYQLKYSELQHFDDEDIDAFARWSAKDQPPTGWNKARLLVYQGYKACTDALGDIVRQISAAWHKLNPQLRVIIQIYSFFSIFLVVVTMIASAMENWITNRALESDVPDARDSWYAEIHDLADEMEDSDPRRARAMRTHAEIASKYMRNVEHIAETRNIEAIDALNEEAIQGWTKLKNSMPHKVVAEASNPVYTSERNRKAYQRRQQRTSTAAPANKNRIRMRGGIDNAAMLMADEALPKSLVHVTTKNAAGEIYMRTNALMIVGTVMLAPRHLFHDKRGHPLGADAIIEVVTIKGATFKAAYDPDALYVFQDGDSFRDIVLYDAGPRLPPFAKRYDNFISDKDLDKMKAFPALLPKLSAAKKAGEQLTLSTMYCPLVEPLEEPLEYYSTDEEEQGYSMTLVKGWQYGAPTLFGDCGAPLIAMIPQLQGKLCGMHVAGSDYTNYSEIVTKELLIPGIMELKRRNNSMVLVQGLPGSAVTCESIRDFAEARNVPAGNYTPVGVVSARALPRHATKTSLIESPIHGIYPVLTEPAPLSPNDSRLDRDVFPEGTSMIQMGVEKYTRPNAPMRLDSRKRAIAAVNEELLMLAQQFRRPRLFSIDEAVNGVPGEEFLSSLNFDSSPGYPYVLSRPKGMSGKAYLFDGEPGKRVINDASLRDEIERREMAGRKGQRLPSLWITSLKDEKRPLAKVRSGKTRAFTIGNVAFTIIVRRYMMDFCAFFYKIRLQCGSAVGINPEGMEWEVLYKRLISCSDTGFAGDFSCYDGTLQAEAIWGLADLINQFYDDGVEEQMMRQVLMSEMIHTEMTCVNTLLFKHQGNPSGCPLTVILNTYVNMVYMVYAWLETAPLEYNSPAFFYQNVKLAIYGDDNIVAVKPYCQSFYNMSTISDVLAKCGLEYTAPDKSTKNAGVKRICEWTFLKRGFHVEGNRVVALMEQQTITEMLNWIRTCEDPFEAVMENASTALGFAFAYGPAYFNAMRTRILQWIARCDNKAARSYMLPDYDFYNRFFGKTRDLPVIRLWNGRLTVDFSEVPQERSPVMEGWKKTLRRVRMQGDPDEKSGETNTPTPSGDSIQEVNHSTNNVLGEPDKMTVAENTSGFTMTQNTATTSAERPESSTMATKAHMFVPDIDWSLTKMVEKWTLVGVFDWTTAMSPRTKILQLVAPTDFWSTNFNHAPFQLFQYWRGTMVVKLQVNGTPFHQGRAIAFWAPLMGFDRVNQWHAQSWPAATTVPHVQLNPAISNTVELCVPFVNPNHMLDLGRVLDEPLNSIKLLNFMGTLTVLVQNTLQAAAGTTTTLKISMHVKFIDNFWAVPKPESLCTTSMRKMRARMQGLGDAFMGTFGNITKVLGQVVGPLKIQDMIAGVSMMDKPLIATEPEIYTPNVHGFYANSTNVTHMERFTLTPKDYEFATPETFGTHQDEMDIKYLTSIWNLDYTMNWSVSQSSGDILNAGYLAPCPYALGAQPPAMQSPGWWVTAAIVTPTMMDYVASKFSFWEGTLKYRFQFIASKYHSGRLAFTVHYGTHNVDELPPTLSARMSQYTVILDLGEENNEFEIEVPYYAIRRLRVPAGPYIPHSFGDRNDYEDYSMGIWCLSVVNPLVAPSGVSSNLDINMWRAAGADFQLQYAGGNNASLRPINKGENRSRPRMQGSNPRKITPTVEKQGPMIHISSEHALVAAPKGGVHIPTRSTVKSINELIKRYARGASYAQNVTETDFYKSHNAAFDIGYMLSGQNVTGTGLADTGRVWGRSGLITWFSKMYRGWHGSTRLKFDIQNSSGANTRTVVAYEPTPKVGFGVRDVYTTPQQNIYLAALTPWDSSNLADTAQFAMISPPRAINSGNIYMMPIEIPYESAYKFLALPDEDNSESALVGHPITTTGTVLMTTQFPAVTTPPTNFTHEWHVEFACGDELRFGILLGPPIIYIDETDSFPDNYTVRP